MDIFVLIKGMGGLALFLYGMNVMGDGLSKLSGGKMESILERLTKTKFKAVLLGTLVTAVIQSSSATTVMVVGFVNSHIMQLSQAVGIIMGANIGTTITSWLLSLTGISGNSLFIKMLKPSSFSPIVAFAGIILIMALKNDERKKNTGSIMIGFAILMYGMESMSSAVAPLAENDSFTSLLTMFSNPVLGMAAGAILTAIIQSSSASIGILQALCLTGAVTYSTAIPIIMGQNVGTCVTALISSVGANKNARRASMIHLYFNLLGTIVFMTLFYGINVFVRFGFLNDAVSVVDIAVIHSLFNIGCTVLMYPFSNVLVKLATLTVKNQKQDETSTRKNLPEILLSLDERFLTKPAYAMELCSNAAKSMAEETGRCIDLVLKLVSDFSKETADEILEIENKIDLFEDALGTYLVKLSGMNLSKTDSKTLSVLLHCTSDLERISDHAANIVTYVQEMKDKNQEFSKSAMEEIGILAGAVHDIVEMTVNVFVNKDLDAARRIEPLEEVIDGLNLTLRQNHIKRLRNGTCTIELGICLEDIITDLERVSDHCSNIAVCLIQVNDDIFDTHEYLVENIRKTRWFEEEVEMWKGVYYIPSNKEGK